jgi:hypothetical protein
VLTRNRFVVFNLCIAKRNYLQVHHFTAQHVVCGNEVFKDKSLTVDATYPRNDETVLVSDTNAFG